MPRLSDTCSRPSGVDIVPIMKAIGVTSETILGHLSDGNAGYFAIAYAMYKVASPARYTVTLGQSCGCLGYDFWVRCLVMESLAYDMEIYFISPLVSRHTLSVLWLVEEYLVTLSSFSVRVER